MSSKLMADPLDIREIFYTNLLMLGFDPENETKNSRVVFNRDMFVVPNRKCMEITLYFLFSKLNRGSAKETFRHCWPIIDKKKEQEFRKVTIEWITKIKKEDSECNLPNMVPSLLLTPSGDKFYNFMFYFSSYVLRHKITTESKSKDFLPVRPTLSNVNKRFAQQIQTVLSLRTIVKKSRLMGFLGNTLDIEGIWTEFAKDLLKEHRQMKKKKRDLETAQKSMKEDMKQLFGKSAYTSKDTLNREANFQKVAETWKLISNFYESEKNMKEELERFLDAKQKTVLRGKNLHFEIPPILLNECEKQLQSGKRFGNIYENGQVNLVSLVRLWNLYLHLLKETLNQYPLKQLSKKEIELRTFQHSNYLNNLNSLRNTLEKETLPDLQQSIENIKENLHPTSFNKLEYDFLPSTPPVVFNTATNKLQPLQQHQDTNTPDVVNHLIGNIKSQIDSCSTTPIHPNRRKETTKTGGPGARSTTRIPHCNNNSNAPLTQQRAPQKSTLKPFSSVLKPPPSRSVHRRGVKSVSTLVSSEKKNHGRSVVNNVSKESKKRKNAKEILLEQITSTVLADSALISRSSTDDETDPIIQAFTSPLAALRQDAFDKKDKCLRTPGPSKKAARSNSPLFTAENFNFYQKTEASSEEQNISKSPENLCKADISLVFTPLGNGVKNEPSMSPENNLCQPDTFSVFTPVGNTDKASEVKNTPAAENVDEAKATENKDIDDIRQRLKLLTMTPPKPQNPTEAPPKPQNPTEDNEETSISDELLLRTPLNPTFSPIHEPLTPYTPWTGKTDQPWTDNESNENSIQDVLTPRNMLFDNNDTPQPVAIESFDRSPGESVATPLIENLATVPNLIDWKTPHKSSLSIKESQKSSASIKESIKTSVSSSLTSPTHEEVDSFIEEVLSNTPVYTNRLKSIFATPTTISFANDYTLLTPSNALNKSFQPANEDDDLE